MSALDELNVRVAEAKKFTECPIHHSFDCCGRRLPQFVTDYVAAFSLAAELRDDGWNCSLNNGLDGTWECEFSRPVRSESPSEHVGITMGETREIHYATSGDVCSPCPAIARAYLEVKTQQ